MYNLSDRSAAMRDEEIMRKWRILGRFLEWLFRRFSAGPRYVITMKVRHHRRHHACPK